MQDAIAVLELDRVLDPSPSELDRHRVALRMARDNRLHAIARSTEQLLTRMRVAADRANADVLTHPIASPSIVRSNNAVAAEVIEFQERLGLAGDRQSLEARRWSTAAGDAWSSAVKAGAGGVDAAGRFGTSTVRAFRSVDLDGDGIADKPRALSAVENVGGAITGAASSAVKATAGAAGAAAEAVTGAAAGVVDAGAKTADAVTSWFKRESDKRTAIDAPETQSPEQG